MLRRTQRFITILLHLGVILFFCVIMFFLYEKSHMLFSAIMAFVFLLLLLLIENKVQTIVLKKMEQYQFKKRETAVFVDFVERLKFCYSIDDFSTAVLEICENQGDISVLYLDYQYSRVFYNSPAIITSSASTYEKLKLNFASITENGIYFFDSNFGLLSNSKQARGFFVVNQSHQLYFMCKYTPRIDEILFSKILQEYIRFEVRAKTISAMSEISTLSREWNLLGDTQKSFLPKQMPTIKRLDIAAYFRPLVNVSGDYYTVLKIDDFKTLVMLGDVSGKGLAAALIMGIVMNTVKTRTDKEDLSGIVVAVDKAIKGMNLDDKYTVLFIGIIDSKNMRIRYINASMADPLIISRSPDGGRIRQLESNASLIGIIDLDELKIAEQKLFTGDMILMASDGISEVMNDEGVELGTTELYLRTLKKSFMKPARNFVNDIAKLVFEYGGEEKLRDDITMLAVKVGDVS